MNVILGVNTSGKSTVFDGITAAMLSPIAQSGFVSQALIRRSMRATPTSVSIELELVLHPTDAPQLALKRPRLESLKCLVNRKCNYELLSGPMIGDEMFKQFFLDRSPGFLLLGYGVFRRIETNTQGELQNRAKVRLPRYDRSWRVDWGR